MSNLNQFQRIYIFFFLCYEKYLIKEEFADADNLSKIMVEVNLGWFAAWDKSSIDSDPLWLS